MSDKSMQRTDAIGAFDQEVASGQRFEFGKNWRAFLSTLTEERIAAAEKSLREMLKIDSLEGKTFLDIGSGSGLFSLAARRLGAKVHSLDYDPNSVGCTRELRSRFFKDDPEWVVEEGSVLDTGYLESLGQFDVVYSWGVLHHTGKMWDALENAGERVKPGGTLFIGIYNDEGRRSRMWWKVKKLYCSGAMGRLMTSIVFIPYFFVRAVAASIIHPEKRFAQYKRIRGMSMTHDWVDWLGGFPFEVATPEEIFHFYTPKGFTLRNLKTVNDLGINQFVFDLSDSD